VLKTDSLTREDAVIGALFFLVGGVIAVVMLGAVGRTFFYQTHMTETVVAACGGPFAPPVVIGPALSDFLFMRSVAFDCTELNGQALAAQIGPLTRAHLYLAASVTALWSLFGVAYQSLAVLAAVLHGGYAAGCFVLGRLFLSRTLACAIALLLSFSPIAVSMLFYLRDFSKGPFIVWGLVLLVLSLRECKAARRIGICTSLGAVIGIGAGFRADVTMVLFPLGLVALSLGPTSRATTLSVRVSYVTLFVATTLLLLAPLRTDSLSGSAGFFMLQGMSEPFRAYLGLTPTSYDLGFRYADEVAFSSIASDLGAETSRDAGATTRPGQEVTPYYGESTWYVVQWLPFFAADVATRAVKSTLLMVGYYGAFSPDRSALDPFPAPFSHLRAAPVLTDSAVSLLNGIARPWLTITIGGVGLFCLLLRVFARSRLEAGCLAFMLLVVLAIPSIQFSSRHFFHLEIIFWLGCASLLSTPSAWAHLRPFVSSFGKYVAAFAILGVAAYFVLVRHQESALQGALEAVMASPRAGLDWVTSSRDERTLVQVPVPAGKREIVAGPPDSLSLPGILVSVPSTVRAEAERLIVEMGGCGEVNVDLKLSYAKRPGVWQAFDRNLSVPLSESGPTYVIFSAFYRATQHFEGLELPAAQAGCLKSLFRVDDRPGLPAVFTAVLPPGWRDRRLHLGLGTP
jgi:hypothetical protein